MTNERYRVQLTRTDLLRELFADQDVESVDFPTRTFGAISMEEMNDMDDPAINFRVTERFNVTVWDADIRRITPTERAD